MRCPKPLKRDITEAEPVICRSAMASAMLLGDGYLPPDAKFMRSCVMDISFALFLLSILTLCINVGSEEKPQIQARKLKSSHGTIFFTFSIVRSDAKGGHGRLRSGILFNFFFSSFQISFKYQRCIV